MMKIDAHNHPDFAGYDAERHIANMDKLGIAKTWLLSCDAPEDEYNPRSISCLTIPGHNAPTTFYRCLDYKRFAPDRFILGYAPDPRDPAAIVKMRKAINTYSVQVCGEVKLRITYDNPDAVDLFRFCGEEGVPVTLHFDYPYRRPGGDFPRRHYWYGGGIDNFENLLRQCPETNFLGHAPGFWAHISNDNLWETVSCPKGPVIPGGRIERMLEKYSNLYIDCSADSGLNALSRDPEYTKKLFLTYPDRFLYGRDHFKNTLAEFIDTLDMPEDFLEKFYHGNAERLLPPVKEPAFG